MGESAKNNNRDGSAALELLVRVLLYVILEE